MTTDRQFIKQRLPELRLAPNKLLAAAPSPKTRTPPYFVRGREPELAYLAQLIHCMPSSINAIVGPPGSGKSTLLSYLALYAARHGYDVVQLSDEHFTSTELLVKQINAQQLQSTSKTRRVGGELDAQVLRGGIDRETTVTETMVASMVSAISERARAADKGLLLLVDEYQNLARAERHTMDVARIFTNYMHSIVPQTLGAGRGEVPAICIAAGLLNLVDAAHDLGVTRLTTGDCVRLGPIAQRPAEQVIRDHLAVRGKRIPPLARVGNADVTRIAAACEGYPHHLTNAGWEVQSAAKSAHAAGDKQVDSQWIDRVIANIGQRGYELYESRWTTLRSTREQYAALVAADIAVGWDNRVPAPVMAEAMERIADAFRSKANEPMDDVQLIRRMERADVLERRTGASKFPAHDGREERNHYCLPIPSFATYIQSLRKEIARGDAVVAKYDDLLEPGALDESAIPAWEWRDRVRREDVEELPTMPTITAAIRRLVRSIKL